MLRNLFVIMVPFAESTLTQIDISKIYILTINLYYTMIT